MSRRRPDVPVIVRSAVPAWLFEVSSRRRLDVAAARDRFRRHAARQPEHRRGRNGPPSAAVLSRLRRARGIRNGVARGTRRRRSWWPTSRRWRSPPPTGRAFLPWLWPTSRGTGSIAAFPSSKRARPQCSRSSPRRTHESTHALRLPLHGGFAPMMPVVRDIPFVARRSMVGRTAARRALGLDEDKPIVLASFGGHRVHLPYEAVVAGGSMTLLLTDCRRRVERQPGPNRLT